MAVARYHITPTGPKLCSATVRSCPYGGAENHFESDLVAKQRFNESPASAEALFREGQPAAKHLMIGSKAATEKIVRSNNWGAAIADIIDQHIEATNVVPEQIEFNLEWDEESPDGDPKKLQHFIFEAKPRLDDGFGKFTNIYRLAWWRDNDRQGKSSIDYIYSSTKGQDSRWKMVPDYMKWEATLGTSLPEADMSRNDWSDRQRAIRQRDSLNTLRSQDVVSRPNAMSIRDLAQKLRDPEIQATSVREDAAAGKRAEELTARYRYERSLERKANNVLNAIKAVENTLIGPYNANDSGVGFYKVDNDRRTVVDEDLSTTSVRGRNLLQLGLDSQAWFTGSWRGETERSRQQQYERIANDPTKGIPYQSPMTFWTASTPDGARWELAMDVHSPENGSSRVHYYDASNPNIPIERATPKDAVDGFATMRDAMEERYGESANWSPALQRDMRVLADIAEGHRAMGWSAANARQRFQKSGLDQSGENAKVAHSELFGGLGKLFG